MTLAYDVVDVFTDRAFAGNPLAVVYDADELSTDQMHAIAREFNLSETTFPTPLAAAQRSADAADYRVRIFTPGGEIPFAGHPTLGTAWALHRRGDIAAGSRRQLCGAGLISVEVPVDPHAAVELAAVPRDQPTALTDGDTGAVAEAMGVAAADVRGPVQSAGCGLSWLYLRVRDVEVVARARPTGVPIDELGLDLRHVQDPLDGVCVYAAATGSGPPDVDVHARVFVPGLGVTEDPATGSAAAGLGPTLAASGYAATHEGARQLSYVITQGVEMGRPSTLYGRVAVSGGVVMMCQVAGQVVAAASGRIAVPDL